MNPLRKSRSSSLRGRISVPGDKSISHRALLLGALSEGTASITGLNDGADVARTAALVDALGARVRRLGHEGEVEVEGWGARGPVEPAEVLDAGNSGTTARLSLGILSRIDGTAVVTGDASLSARPMLRVVAPLRAMGASIDGRAHGDRLPLSVRGAPLIGMDHELTVASAQVKSALLLAGLGASGTTSVTEPTRSRDHTENMLRVAGVEVRVEGTKVEVTGGARPTSVEWQVPGDISSALFLLVAALLVDGSNLTIEGVGLNPTRTGALDVLEAMGADISIERTGDASGEPRGDVTVRSSALTGCDVEASVIPTLIDEIPILAVAAAHAEGATTFSGVGELRAKETDRLSAIVDSLRAVGGSAEMTGDSLTVEGGSGLAGGGVSSRGDHRMAMAFAVAGLASTGPIKVEGWSCVDTSFPTFLEVLGRAQGGPT